MNRTIDSPPSCPASSPSSFPRRPWDWYIPVTRGPGASRPRNEGFRSQSGSGIHSDDEVKRARSNGIFFTADDTFSSFFAGSPPPYQIFYVSPSPNLLDFPYTNRATGVVNHPYPFTYPAKGDQNLDFSQFLPLGGYPFTAKNNVSPYTQVYSL